MEISFSGKPNWQKINEPHFFLQINYQGMDIYQLSFGELYGLSNSSVTNRFQDAWSHLAFCYMVNGNLDSFRTNIEFLFVMDVTIPW